MVSNIMVALRNILDSAAELDMIDANPCYNVILPNKRAKETNILSKSEQNKIEHAVIGSDIEIVYSKIKP
ncbi:hypothetical protein FACS1894208_09930 [Clostridia bacterium]|nr:hypothetical protein FACS1894208_09930 [Clostridia bacterium]